MNDETAIDRTEPPTSRPAPLRTISGDADLLFPAGAGAAHIEPDDPGPARISGIDAAVILVELAQRSDSTITPLALCLISLRAAAFAAGCPKDQLDILHRAMLDIRRTTAHTSCVNVLSPKGRFGQLLASDPKIGNVCRMCDRPFEAGDVPALVEIGPADLDEQAKADEGKAHNVEAAMVHERCAYPEA